MATRRQISRKPPETVDAIPVTEEPSARRRLIIIIAVVVAAIGLAISLGIYFIQVRPMQRLILKVNDGEISIGYLIRRLESANSVEIDATMWALTDEELIRQGASRLGIDVTDEELDEALHDLARGANESISEAEFQNWYRLQLNESRLNKTEFQELWRTRLAGSRIYQMEAERVATVAEQIRVSLIVTDVFESIMEAYERLEEGEAFADVVADVSEDPAVAENGGDQGWFPRAALPANARFVFDLTVGEHSPPISLAEDGSVYVIFLLTDRAASRDIDEANLNIIRVTAMDEWLLQERIQSEITYHGLDWSETYERYSYGSKTQAWIAWQLAKRGSVTPPTE